MKKRMAAVLLWSALMASVFVGCKNSGDDDKTGEIGGKKADEQLDSEEKDKREEGTDDLAGTEMEAAKKISPAAEKAEAAAKPVEAVTSAPKIPVIEEEIGQYTAEGLAPYLDKCFVGLSPDGDTELLAFGSKQGLAIYAEYDAEEKDGESLIGAYTSDKTGNCRLVDSEGKSIRFRAGVLKDAVGATGRLLKTIDGSQTILGEIDKETFVIYLNKAVLGKDPGI